MGSADSTAKSINFFDLKLTISQVFIIISIIGGGFVGYVNLASEVYRLNDRTEQLNVKIAELNETIKELRKEVRQELRPGG